MRKLFKWLFRRHGWKVGPPVPPGIRKCVVVAAPHTSNWDLVYALGALEILGLRVRFTIKMEWMRFPFSLLMKSAGGIGIDRSPKVPGQERRSMVDAMVELFKENDDLILMVTPEGTRSRRDKWKTGFYHVAVNAGVPILLGYVNYGKKEAGIGKIIHPSANSFDKDMREIMQFYSGIPPKYPENFSIDLNYQ